MLSFCLNLYIRPFRSLESDLRRSKKDQSEHHTAFEKQIEEHKTSVAEYKKTIKALNNEKSVLSAAIEARDSKLTKMEKLKKEILSLQKQVEENHKLKNQVVRRFCFCI